MKKNLIFITGFFGAPLMQKAQSLAKEQNLPLFVLDEEIEKADGRSARRICMMMGEHEYRNKEYEALKAIVDGDVSEAVICCGDGVMHDDMSRDILESHELIVLGADMTIEDLWEVAKIEKNSCHAFMHFGNEEQQWAAFEKLYERQRVLFTPYI